MPRKLRNKPGYPERGKTESSVRDLPLSVVSGKPVRKDSTACLIDEILSADNISKAVDQVVRNRGAPGIDNMTVDELPLYIEQHGFELFNEVRMGKYKPQAVKRARIPKPDGGERLLGIPAVIDRMLQQAVSQVLTPIYEPLFSDGSYGFRPGRSAHDAVLKVKEYYDQGYTTAVDIDLEKYFDTLNHDTLMNIIRQDIGDKAVAELIKRYLKSGIMEDGVVIPSERGSPQGGNLSPLLANIYLSRFDRLMEARNHPFVRYADDIMIFAKSNKAGERIMKSAAEFLENTMKLKVNEEKSRVGLVTGMKFLGFRIYRIYTRNSEIKTGIAVHQKSIERFKIKVKQMTKKNSAVSMKDTLRNLSMYFRGWINYYGLADVKRNVTELAKWLRRRIRAKYLKQWKHTYCRGKNIKTLAEKHWKGACPLRWKAMWDNLKYTRSIWKMSVHYSISNTLNNEYLESQGFPKMLELYNEAHSRLLNRRIPAGTYGGVRGRQVN